MHDASRGVPALPRKPYSSKCLVKLSEKGYEQRSPVNWAVYGGQNGPKSIVSVARKATLQALPRLFGQFLEDEFCELLLCGVLGSSTQLPSNTKQQQRYAIWRMRRPPIEAYPSYRQKVAYMVEALKPAFIKMGA